MWPASSTKSKSLNSSFQHWLISLFIPDQCQMRLEFIPAVTGGEAGIYTGQFTGHTHTCHSHTLTLRGNLECPVKQVENMQIHTERPELGSNPAPMSGCTDHWTSIPVHQWLYPLGIHPLGPLKHLNSYWSNKFSEMYFSISNMTPSDTFLDIIASQWSSSPSDWKPLANSLLILLLLNLALLNPVNLM